MEQQQTIPQTALEWCRIHYPDRMYEWNLRKMTEYAKYYHASHIPVPRLTQEEIEKMARKAFGDSKGHFPTYLAGYNAANTVCSTGWTDADTIAFAEFLRDECRKEFANAEDSTCTKWSYNTMETFTTAEMLAEYKRSHPVQVDSRIQQK